LRATQSDQHAMIIKDGLQVIAVCSFYTAD